jgi:ribosomal protein S27E
MASALTAASLVNARKRLCPKCGRKQSVSVFAAHQAVTCRRCGSSIPPPEAGAASGSSHGDKALAPATRKR